MMSYLGENIGKLGFGMMRLPMKDEKIDIEHTKKMVDLFMEAGFTYFDTAWAYTGSEDAVRQALVERYPRDSYQLATKNAAWIECKTREDAIGQFETSLKQTGAGYFDFYLLHNLGSVRTKSFDDFDMWSFFQEKKQEGLIKHLGFSFHDRAEVLEEILKAHPEMEFVQLQINYADWEDSAIESRKCYQLARKYEKPVIIMEPVKGGLLAAPPQQVAELLKAAEPDASPASWAMRFAADLDGIITVLSGMSNLEQMQDNIACMKGFRKLTEEQRSVLQQAREELDKIPIIPCTTCDYCSKVCPENIGISGSLTSMNLLTLFKDKKFALNKEYWAVGALGKKRADQCTKCGACEDACPQHISIRQELEKTSRELLG